MKAPTKTHQDFDVETPSTLRQFLVEELSTNNQERVRRNLPIEHYNDEDINQLMPKVFAHIESKALELYKSNEPWAIREYIVQHILREPVASEDNIRVAGEISKPVERWQSDTFDPLQQMRLKLEVSRKSRGYIRELMRPAKWFVSDAGRKRRYTENEILQFVRKLANRYDKRDAKGHIITEGRDTSSFVTKISQFKRFLDLLPEDELTGRKQVIPFELPKLPDKFNQPIFSHEDIELIIYKAIMDFKPETVLRMALATVYGCRVGEIAYMDSSNIDLKTMTVNIPTEKKGVRKPQPIPPSLKPLFMVPLHKTRDANINNQLKAICKKARIPWLKGMGCHAIRRAVVTILYGETGLKELHIKRFMRWSQGRGMGVMPRYIRIPTETTDAEVLEVHPFRKMWEQMIPFIEYMPQWADARYLPEWKDISSRVQLYNITQIDTM